MTGLSPFERAQLVLVARGGRGEILPRATVSHAMGGDEFAKAHPVLSRLYRCMLDDRPSVFVAPQEATALLNRNPEPPVEGGAYGALMRLYRLADQEAQALDGPDPRARQAMDRLAIEILNSAVALCGVAEAPPAPKPEGGFVWRRFMSRTLAQREAA